MTTNILSLPLASVEIETGHNEDWIDPIVFLVDTNDPAGQQLDLSGIKFDMEVRRTPPDHEVILTGSTDDGRLSVGTPPDFGYLVINVPVTDMETRRPGDYVGDIRATADSHTRVCVQFSLSIVQGITR